MPKLYLSQANQGHNAGPLGYTEKAGMDAIIHALLREFASDPRFTVKHALAGDRIDTATENCDEANRWGADYYVALHSNAGGVGARGTIGFYHSRSPKGKALCAAIVKALAPLSPGADHGIQTKDGFIEVHRPNAPSCLIELEAHDWKIGVEWLVGKRPLIARALYEGICEGVGLEPKNGVVDYRHLKKAALAIAKKLGLPTTGVNGNVVGKGPAFEALLRAIADHK